MGSQNVTDFRSVALRERIRARIARFNPRSPEAVQQAMSAGAEAVGRFTKTNPYVKSLSSAAVRSALGMLTSLASDIRRSRTRDQVQRAIEAYGVPPDVRQPIPRLAAGMRSALTKRLTSTQQDTEPAFAANDAILQALIDVVSEVSHEKKKAAEASLDDLEKALKRAPIEDLARLFFEKVIASLVNRRLDAARGPISRSELENLKEKIRKRFAPELTGVIAALAEGEDVDSDKIPDKVKTQKWREKVDEKLDEWRPPEPPVE